MPILKLYLDPRIDDLTPRLKLFFEAMLYKLARNVHKGRWEDLNLQTSVARLKGETHELVAAIDSGNSVEILMEAADVANFAMIVADIATDKVPIAADKVSIGMAAAQMTDYGN